MTNISCRRARCAIVLATLAGFAPAFGQVAPAPRVTPASAQIFVTQPSGPQNPGTGTATFNVSNAPPGAAITTQVLYPTAPGFPAIPGWLSVKITGAQLVATATPGTLPRGKYLAFITVFVNQVSVGKAGVVMVFTPQDGQYRFQNAADNSEILTSFAVSSAQLTANGLFGGFTGKIIVDYNNINSSSDRKAFNLVTPTETVDGHPWLTATLVSGVSPGQTGDNTRNAIQVKIDLSTLQVAADPYVGYIEIYEPGNTNNRSLLEVDLTVSSTVPRVTPATTTINVPSGGTNSATFAISGVPLDAKITYTIAYPKVPGSPLVTNWLTASVSGLSITAIANSTSLSPGRYLSFVTVLANGVPIQRAGVLMSVAGGGPFSFQVAATGIPITGALGLSSTTPSARVIVDYNDPNAMGKIAIPFGAVAQPVNAPPSWLIVTPDMGTTGTLDKNVMTITADLTGLSVSGPSDPATFPYAGYIGVSQVNRAPSWLEVELTVTPPVPGPCTYILTPATISVAATAGSGNFHMDTTSNCSWAPVAQDSWVAVASGATVLGPGSVNYSYNANLGAPRTGRITAGGQTFSISQGGIVTSGPIMAQIAASGGSNGWNTTLVLVNTDNTKPASFTLNFHGDDGLPLILPLSRRGSTDPPTADSKLTGTIPKGGAVTYQTVDDLSGGLVQGYAELVDGSPTVRGQAVFQQRNPAGFNYEAAVPMERGGRHFSIPFDNVGYVTSLALVNTNSSPGAITITARDGNGRPLGARNVPLNPNQHLADTAKTLAGMFVDGQRGILDFDSTNVDVAALGLRFGVPFTSLALISRDPPAAGTISSGNPLMAQIAAYGGWKTAFILTNTNTSQAVTASLNIRSDAGTPLSLNFNQVAPVSRALGNQNVLSASIPLGGTVIFETAENQTATVTGFAELVSGGDSIRGQAIFQQTSSGLAYEAAVPMNSAYANFLMPFDNDGYTTSLALVNPDAARTATITVTFRGEQGGALSPPQTLRLSPGQHVADSSVRMFGNALDRVRGVIEFSSDVPLGAIGLRFSTPFTSFAIIPK